ncbi:hypothetical protein SAMN04490248_13521 [Salinihabitans flavidus]|uniref:Cytochrome P460 n=1 Tax=Salinihabitans flavidus TaxID=569882 RepID=A0A1H8VVD1_9RHOB|nr:hypothetical protein [Salinihabitans flavidus]SEP19402.1 hypothetical protein SAMN04490248_13521 [Salinihabitans flavidus]
MKGFIGKLGLACVLATPLAAQDAPFGTSQDIEYADKLWAEMQEQGLVGEDAILALPYEGREPHGLMLETFYSTAQIADHTGTLVVKRNYGPEGVTGDEVLSDPAAHLGSVTVMYQRAPGYDDETGNWFYAKYLPDGTLDRNPKDMALAGLVGKGADAGCIACHQGAAPDYLFTTDAKLPGMQ